MERLSEFFASDTGSILAISLVIVGLFDIFIIHFILRRKAKNMENEQLNSPSQVGDDVSEQVKGLHKVANLLTVSAVLFLAFGIFGLTR
ncbi:MAG: hypothetical protein R3D71_09820 [Rickettsiales bacterium]